MLVKEEYKKPFYIIDHSKKLAMNSRLLRVIRKQLDHRDPTPLNRHELQNYAYYGINDRSLRPMLWKVFLYHYSENKFKTEMYMKERKAAYREYKAIAMEAKKRDRCIDKVIVDDVNRTTLFPMHASYKEEAAKGDPAGRGVRCEFLDSRLAEEDGSPTHREVIKEILLVFKTTNPAIEYVQGMNMLILVIYYVFASSDDVGSIESDTFFCFLNLTSEIGEYFIESMDDQYCGIAQKLNRVIDVVREFDRELYMNMKEKNLTSNIFHFRWVLLSFAQEFPIEEVVWLWDKFLSDSTRFELVLYCAAAKIILLKKKIVESDFAACMELFQTNKDVDVYSMFFKADEMRRTAYSHHQADASI